MLKTVLILALAPFLIVILPVFGEPVLKDPDLAIEKFVSGICCNPTTMAFVDDDILILEQETGKVRLIRDGIMQEKSVLDVNVKGKREQGLLGITTVGITTVYLYYTESTRDDGEPIGNHIYRYEWNGQELVNPVLVKALPGKQSYHNGGAMVTGLDGTVYAVIGDQGTYGVLQNWYPKGSVNDTSVILRVAPEGPYYAMGVRNSFGLAIDPITGNLWDTENGDNEFDEINLVPPNFNSGWMVIMGPATESELEQLPGYDEHVYSDPEFSWQQVVAPTAISFVDSKPFEKYKNSVFVGDCIYGNLYKFELNPDRTGFVFDNPELADNVINTGESMDEIVFGTGFRCITDIEVGPDGLLYVVSRSDNTIYRIMPKTMILDKEIHIVDSTTTYLEYAIIVVIVIGAITGGGIYLKKSRKQKMVQ